MTVMIPTPLRSYTAQHGEVQAEGTTLAAVLADLDRRFPGLRFRIITEQDTIRPHIKIFVNEEQTSTVAVSVRPDDRVHILCALSGG